MRYVNSWEQVPDQTIDSVLYRGTRTTIVLGGGDFLLSVESAVGDNTCVYFYDANVSWADSDILEPEIFSGKQILKVVVPFFGEGGRGDAGIMFYFYDGTKALLAPEDWGTPLRIT